MSNNNNKPNPRQLANRIQAGLRRSARLQDLEERRAEREEREIQDLRIRGGLREIRVIPMREVTEEMRRRIEEEREAARQARRRQRLRLPALAERLPEPERQDEMQVIDLISSDSHESNSLEQQVPDNLRAQQYAASSDQPLTAVAYIQELIREVDRYLAVARRIAERGSLIPAQHDSVREYHLTLHNERMALLERRRQLGRDQEEIASWARHPVVEISSESDSESESESESVEARGPQDSQERRDDDDFDPPMGGLAMIA